MKSIVIIGSGTMGSGIAALIANAGYNPVLLDIAQDGPDKSVLARNAIKRMTNKPQQHFTAPENADRIMAGNLEDDLALLIKADWVIEVVVEDLNIKRALYNKIAQHISDDTILSSNTSTFTLSALTEGLSEDLQKRFFITHFFNPPRYLPLLEFVAPGKTHAKYKEALQEFCSDHLGRTVVTCNDVPGFIANRIGCTWLAIFLDAATRHNLSPSMIDHHIAKLMHVPKTGIFGLIDLIGIDVFSLIMQSLTSTLPKTDPLFKMTRPSSVTATMVQNKWLGNKTNIGFYKTSDNGTKLELELATMTYRPTTSNHPDISISDLFTDSTSSAIRDALIKTLAYACYVMPQATSSALMVDIAMRNGYNWQHGPFELIDTIALQIGQDWLAQGTAYLELDIDVGNKPFYKRGSTLSSDTKYVKIPSSVLQYDTNYLATTKALLLSNSSANLIDIGDQIACFVITNEDKTIDKPLLELLDKSINYLTKHNYLGLIIYGGTDFCRGANIKIFLEKIIIGDYDYIEQMIRYGTKVFDKLKQVSIPSIAAVSGFALGGGCELMMHCSKAVVHCNARIGLVEPNLGLIPGWGGCREILYRASKNSIASILDQILRGKMSSSAEDARKMSYITDDDIIIMGQHNLLQQAKAHLIKTTEYKSRPTGTFAKGVSSYVDILEQYRAENQYSQEIDTIAAGIIKIYANMSSFDDTQTEIFMSLIRGDYAQKKISEMLKR